MKMNTRIALSLALLVSSTSLALAQGFDPNLGNRIPLLNEPGVYGYRAGGVGGTTWLLPDAPSATMQSAPVGLYGGGYGGLRTAPVGLNQGSYDGYDGPYRQDAIALGMARLYGAAYNGGSYGYQTSNVGLYQRPYAAGRMYRRPYAAARMYGRPYGAFRSAPVGLYRGGYGGYRGYGGYGALQSAPVALGGWRTPFDVDRFDRASSPYSGGGY